MKVKAKFIGVNGLGYENGKVYKLIFLCKSYYIEIRIWNTTNGMCDYSSLKSFLNNWEVIS